jgi:hypothetical protein
MSRHGNPCGDKDLGGKSVELRPARSARLAFTQGRLVSTAAMLVAVLLAMMVVGGCGGVTGTTRTTRATATTAEPLAVAEVTTTAPGAAAKPTSTTLSQHDRVQQEQAQQEAAAAATSTTSTTMSASSAGASSSGSASGSGKTLVLSDGTRLSSAQADAAYAYEPLAIGAQQKQQRLIQTYERCQALSGHWSQSDYSAFKSMLADQKTLVSELQGANPPEPYAASHQDRIRAAKSFLSGWQAVLNGDAGASPAKNQALVAQGMRDHNAGVKSLASAQSQFQAANSLFRGSHWE